MSRKKQSSPYHNDKFFLAYPAHRIFGIIEDEASVEKVKEALYGLGYSEQAVVADTGADAVKRVDAEGAHSGVRGRLTRAMQHLGGEAEIFKRYSLAMQHGKYVISAPIDTDEDRDAVADLFRMHGASQINFFGKGSVESL